MPWPQNRRACVCACAWNCWISWTMSSFSQIIYAPFSLHLACVHARVCWPASIHSVKFHKSNDNYFTYDKISHGRKNSTNRPPSSHEKSLPSILFVHFVFVLSFLVVVVVAAAAITCASYIFAYSFSVSMLWLFSFWGFPALIPICSVVVVVILTLRKKFSIPMIPYGTPQIHPPLFPIQTNEDVCFYSHHFIFCLGP